MGRRITMAASAGLLALASLAAGSATAAAVYVQVAPPPPRYEVVPAPRHGQVWVNGHWQWSGRQYVWVPGRFLAARAGYYYDEPRWVRHGDRWAYSGGGWARGHRDRDRDGIPDRRDRDRDNDGVPNRHDRDPRNPWRH